MHSLIDLHNEHQAEYLNAALRRYGVNSAVIKNGVYADGAAVYTISCFNIGELERARRLFYRDDTFLSDIHPETALIIRQLRYNHSRLLLRAATSKTALGVPVLALVAVLLGYYFGF